jgi:iron(III) transport system ATP-binding protein
LPYLDRKESQTALRDATMQPAGVTFEDVSIAYGKNVVIRQINLAIRPGEFFAFLGPSGSGKSTLLRAIAGFGPRPTGRILIGDEDVTNVPPWTRNVGMVFQNYALWPHMSVRRNVAFGLEERHLPRAEIRQRVDEALELVGLLDFAERRPSQLSGGQQQRVALARTIVIRPRVLLLDEPLSNLDANLRIRMRFELLQLQRRLQITTVFVTHDQEEANTISDRIAVLDQGIIQQVGSPIELYDRPANRFVAGFLGSANLINGEIRIEDSAPVFHGPSGLLIPLAGRALPGQNFSILFRPQSVEIRGRDEAPVPDCVRLDGAIHHREFLGNTVRYTATVGTTQIRVDASHKPGRIDFKQGDPVALYIGKDQIRVLTE